MWNFWEGVSGANLSQTQSPLLSEYGCFFSNLPQCRFGLAWPLNKDHKNDQTVSVCICHAYMEVMRPFKISILLSWVSQTFEKKFTSFFWSLKWHFFTSKCVSLFALKAYI